MQTTFPTDDGEYDFLQAEMLTSSYNQSLPKWLCIDGTYALNNMRATALAFAKGYFNQSLYCYVDSGKIRIGIREQQKRIGSWTAWDNFKLVYLAGTTENYREAVLTYLEQAKGTERLAKIKKLDAMPLSETITKTEQALQSDIIEQLRENLSLLSHAIKETRKSLEKQEFGESMITNILSYRQIMEEEESKVEILMRNKRNSEQDSIGRILDEANSYYYIGNLVLDHHVELALTQFNKAFILIVDVPETYNSNVDSYANILSTIYQETEKYDEAINVWEKLAESRIKFRGNNSKVVLAGCYYEIGNILNSKKKEYLKAEEFYRKATSIIEILYDEACKSNNEDFINRYKQILASFLNGLSYSLANQKKYEEALTIIGRSIELQPEDANYYDSKGEIMYRSGDKQGAKAMWEKVVSIAPSFAEKHNSQLYKSLMGK